MNWKQTVSEVNRRKYVVPEGWDTKEKIARELDCSEDKVAAILKPGIDSGDIERNEFHVWDDKRRCVIRVACFRVAVRGAKKTPKAKPEAGGTDLPAKLRKAVLANPSKTDREIARCYRGATREMVAAVRLKVRKG